MGDERKNRVFIGGISDRIQKEDIEKEFGRFGKLTNVWVAQNPPGFAFVEYDHISEADVAVTEMNGQSFLGSSNKLRVEHSHGGSSRSRMRRGGGGGFGDRGMRGGGGGYRNDRGSRDGGFRDGGGYRNGFGSNGFESRRPRDIGGGGGGGYRNGGGGGGYSADKRRSFGGGGGAGGGRFNGAPRYRNGSAERSYSGSYGGRRSRSPPIGRSKYGGRMDRGFSPVPGTFVQNHSPY